MRSPTLAVIMPRMEPARAPRNISPAGPSFHEYGGEVMISLIVLKETMPAVAPKAKMRPARTTLGKRKRANGRRKYCVHFVLSAG